MAGRFGILIVLLFGLSCVLFPPPAWPQLAIGQYEEEAPLGTWNIFETATAASLGRGGTCFSLASDCSAALTNPALLLLLPKWTAMVNGSLTYASLFKYSLVNTGVLGSDGNLALTLYSLDFSGLSLHLGKWAFAITIGARELYNRPPAQSEYSYGGITYYSIDLTQKGMLRTLNLSAARRINDWLSAGLGINLSAGDLKREMIEEWPTSGISITDRKTGDIREFYLNGGLLANLADRVRIAAVFRTPSSRKLKNSSLLEYSAGAGKTEIAIEASAEDNVKQPLILGLGASARILPHLDVALDISYYGWSHYAFNYFGEAQQRNFRDVMKAATGMEWLSSFKLFGQRIDIPIRLGLAYDPQPMKEPRSSYLAFTFGGGLSWQNLHLDFGVLIGRESGSGNDLATRKLLVSLAFEL